MPFFSTLQTVLKRFSLQKNKFMYISPGFTDG